MPSYYKLMFALLRERPPTRRATWSIRDGAMPRRYDATWGVLRAAVPLRERGGFRGFDHTDSDPIWPYLLRSVPDTWFAPLVVMTVTLSSGTEVKTSASEKKCQNPST